MISQFGIECRGAFIGGGSGRRIRSRTVQNEGSTVIENELRVVKVDMMAAIDLNEGQFLK